MPQPLGLYLSVPFCRGKCTFCNFASDAFSASQLAPYLAALEQEIRGTRERAALLGAGFTSQADTVYFGGGTPSLLLPRQIRDLFGALRSMFDLVADAELTVECAPGQLSDDALEEWMRQGVNRLSFGAQSFVDAELRSVGRKHLADECIADLARARAAGIGRLSVDLIAGLPGQTERSWTASLDAVIASGVGHASVYMLEVDDGSRLGQEVLAGGARYGAAQVPGDDECVAFYDAACDRFDEAGLRQYEISNFARAGQRSRHNMKYWRRLPYLGFGLDAHSMLPLAGEKAVRFSNTDDLETYTAALAQSVCDNAASLLPLHVSAAPDHAEPVLVSTEQALEETLFLGLRLNRGVRLDDLRARFGDAAIARLEPAIRSAEDVGLLRRGVTGAAQSECVLQLTQRGRALSNEVFGRLLDALDAPSPQTRPHLREAAVA